MACERFPATAAAPSRRPPSVLAEKEWGKSEGRNRLSGGELMYVTDPSRRSSTSSTPAAPSYAITDPAQEGLLHRADTQGRCPRSVSSEWLRTLHEGTPVSVPTVPGTAGQTANAVTGSGNARYDKVGTVLKSLDGTRMQHYVDAAGQGGPHLRVHLPTPAQQQAVGQRQLDRLRGVGEPGGRRGSAPFEGEGAKWHARGARRRSTTAPAPPAAATPSATRCGR